MKIEKFVHSCLRLTEDGEQLLFDPGKFSFIDGRVDAAALAGVDVLVLTHAHPDHLDVNAIHAIVDGNDTRIVGNDEVADVLARESLKVEVFNEGTRQFGAFDLEAIPTVHAPILADHLPKTTAYRVNRRVLNIGDSLDPQLADYADTEVLCMPVMAPFLTELDAFQFALSLRPHSIVPLHDGYARDFFLMQRYDVFESAFARHGIRFLRMLEVGASIEI